LLVIGSPGLLWSLAILLIREPQRRAAIAADASGAGGASGRHAALWRVAPIYLVVATASLVDNAVGAWAPTLLIRDFGRDAAQVGLQLGLLLTIGFGGGVLLGGWLSDRVGRGGRWSRKLSVCLISSLLALPVCWAIDAAHVRIVMAAVHCTSPCRNRHGVRLLLDTGRGAEPATRLRDGGEFLPQRRARRGTRPHLGGVGQ